MSHVTIPDQDSFVTYPSQTGTGPFSVPFVVFEKADIVVLVDGEDVGQAGFSYTATSSTTGGYQTGTITLAAAAAAEDVTIYRQINPKRTSDMGPGPQARDALNSALDRVHALHQDVRRDLDRSLRMALGETPDDIPIGTGGQVLALNSDLKPRWIDIISSGLVALGTGVAGLLATTSTAILGALDGIKKFATYALLIGMTSATGLVDSGIYYVAARAAEDDGGVGMFQWRAASTTTADGGTVLAHATLGTGRFHRLNVGSWVDIRWFPGGAPGSDCSAALAAAQATGKHVYWPKLTTGWVLGSGTALPVWNSHQWWITDAVDGAVTTITLTVTLPAIGTTSTRCNESGIGDGFRIIGPTNAKLLNGVYFRTFSIGRGTIENSHQVATLGDAGAAGASYRFYTRADINQRYGRLFTNAPSGTLTVGRVLTGGTSGATAIITSVTAGSTYEIAIERSSATPFQAGETITEATSGYTATVSSITRPDHIFKAVNYAGDFASNGTVEGAYDGAADGLHCDSNVYIRIDEIWIAKYFARCRRNFSGEDARVVNGHFTADMELALVAAIWLNVTSSTAKAATYVGYAQIYIAQVKTSVYAGGTASVYVGCNRAGVEIEALDVNIEVNDFHEVDGVVVNIAFSTLRSIRIRVAGMMKPTTTGKYAVSIVEGASGVIEGLDVEVVVAQQSGASAIAALVNVTGTPEGIIRHLSGAGTITARLVLGSTPPQGLRIMETESGVPMGASALYGPDFVAVNITVAAADFDMVRGGAGGITIWRPEMDILIIGTDWEWSAAPTANHIDAKLDVAGVNVKSHSNTGVVTQSQSYWASGAVAVAKGEAVEMYVRPDGTYATANADVVGRIKYVPLWNDA